ncbi:SH2 domain-containing protein 3C [Channa argus]|uniref:SH2 domain-containing protein 3C n=1 Tax=Channa argus TaxID=215402 RepID=A0A6G1PYW1_CHAAH|nr:SH2 domain-containing protein 3C [Channa argus]
MNKRKKGFKWFGSLTNLSPCRSQQKAKLKAAPKHDGRSAEAEDLTVDDMKVSATSPSYACTSHMYTHVGTVPRSERHKKKETTKKRGEGEGGSGGQGQWKPGEHVRDSPLLSALSSLSLTGLDQPVPMSALARPLPATPLLSRASPLTSKPQSCVSEHSGGPIEGKDALKTCRSTGELSNMATISPKVVSAQDVYVPMNRIAEAARQETARSVNSAQQMATADGRRDVTDGSGEYVKVSESLVLNHGDFLIRDSQSSQGDFVLTSHWEQKTLHFLISKMVVQSSETYTRVQYRLEGEAFDSLPALVRFYVGSRTDLTQGSGAQIHQPVNRTLPLSYLQTAFGTAVSPKSCDRGLKNGNVSGEERVCPQR